MQSSTRFIDTVLATVSLSEGSLGSHHGGWADMPKQLPSHFPRIARVSPSTLHWPSRHRLTLVPPVPRGQPNASRLTDRPDGHDPRDQYVGHRRIDVPIVPGAAGFAQVRFNCIRVTEPVDDGMVYLRQFSLHKKLVPWQSPGAVGRTASSAGVLSARMLRRRAFSV